MEMLERYKWRGNVRELENVIERAVILETTDSIQSQSLTDEIKEYTTEPPPVISYVPSKGLNLDEYIGEIERNIIINTLKKTGWIKKKAADLLNLSFRSFRYKLQKYHIEKKE